MWLVILILIILGIFILLLPIDARFILSLIVLAFIVYLIIRVFKYLAKSYGWKAVIRIIFYTILVAVVFFGTGIIIALWPRFLGWL